MPDFTYLQHAQPTTLGHFLLGFAYAAASRCGTPRAGSGAALDDCSPAGAASTNGARLPLDRERMRVAARLRQHQRPQPRRDVAARRADQSDGRAGLDRDRHGRASPRSCRSGPPTSSATSTLADEHCRTSVIMPNKKNPVRAVVHSRPGARARRHADQRHRHQPDAVGPDRQPQHVVRARAARSRGAWTAWCDLLGEVLERMTLDVARLREQARHGHTYGTELADLLLLRERVDARTAHEIVGATISAQVGPAAKPLPSGPGRGVHGGGRPAAGGRRRRAVARGAAGAGRREPARHRVLRAADGARHGRRPAGGRGCAVRRRGRRGEALRVPGDAANGRRGLPRADMVGGGSWLPGARDAGEPPALPARLPSSSASHGVGQAGSAGGSPAALAPGATKTPPSRIWLVFAFRRASSLDCVALRQRPPRPAQSLRRSPANPPPARGGDDPRARQGHVGRRGREPARGRRAATSTSSSSAGAPRSWSRTSRPRSISASSAASTSTAAAASSSWRCSAASVDEYVAYLKDRGIRLIEISDGVIDLAAAEKLPPYRAPGEGFQSPVRSRQQG